MPHSGLWDLAKDTVFSGKIVPFKIDRS